MEDRKKAVFFVVALGTVAAVPHIFDVPSFTIFLAVIGYTAAYVYRHALSVGPGDYVTLVRAILVAYVAGFFLTRPGQVEAYLAASAFSVSAALDAVDGAVARRYGTTSLGEELDVEVDGMATLVGVAVGVAHGWLPVAYVAVGLARYVFVAGVKARRAFDMRVSELSRSSTRNALSALQTGVIVLSLFPTVPGSLTRPMAYAAMIPFVLWFLRDWTAVCGRYNYIGERG